MAAAPLNPGTRIGPYPYEIVKAIGDLGNMSQVYLASVPGAQGKENASLVVLKIARTDEEHNASIMIQTVENEVDRLRRLKHPGIVRIFPVQRDGGMPNLAYIAKAIALPDQPPFSVMEHLSGGALGDLIAAGPMDIGMALEIGRSIAATLDYMHSRGHVHLDMKPDNVLFRKPAAIGVQVEPVLIDLGIARDIGQGGLEARTAQYAPPERMRQEKPGQMPPPDPSMDVYALGVILYEMLTGRLPFKGRSPGSLAAEIVKGDYPLSSRLRREVNADLDNFLALMLHPEPKQRPSAEQAATKMEDIAIRGNYLPRYPSSDNVGQLLKVKKRGHSGGGLADTLFAVAAMLLLFFVLGTYPYWRGHITPSPDSWALILLNISDLIGQQIVPGIVQGAGSLGQWVGSVWQQVNGG